MRRAIAKQSPVRTIEANRPPPQPSREGRALPGLPAVPSWATARSPKEKERNPPHRFRSFKCPPRPQCRMCRGLALPQKQSC
jgi:hypothetical protein